MKRNEIWLLVFSMILILLISLIIFKMASQKHYLNYNSTSSNEFNYSDMLYPENVFDRERVETLKAKVLNLVNAPLNAKCIINSGATESIASCVKWANDYIHKGTIVGSEFDHSAIEQNSKNNGMKYEKINLSKDPLPENTAAVFISQVNSATGEYQKIDDVVSNIENEKYLIDGGTDFPNENEERVLQYHPLVFLDATQSFMKLPIDMDSDNLNGVFFSVHKIGGEQGLGFLIINESNFPKFKPLIAGEQQNGLRGGTLPLQRLLEFPEIFDRMDDAVKRKSKWEQTFSKFKNSGIDVYHPKGNHLYSTFLIDTKEKCSKEVISDLAQKGIYIGAKSACSLETKTKLDGGASKNLIRVSFRDPEELTDDSVSKIIDELI